MASINKVILIGNLGRDPEVKYGANGNAVCSLSLATTRQWKDQAGEKKEETEWHRVVLYQRLAEVAGEYTKKGSSLYIEGRLKTRKWTDKDGVEKYTTEIIGEEMKLLGDGGGRKSGGDAEYSRQREAAPNRSATNRTTTANKPTNPSFDDIDDDIPF